MTDNYLVYSRDNVKRWMQQVVAGVDNRETHHSVRLGKSWSVWELAQAANSHFDFTSGDADAQIVELAREVLGPDAPQGDPNEYE